MFLFFLLKSPNQSTLAQNIWRASFGTSQSFMKVHNSLPVTRSHQFISNHLYKCWWPRHAEIERYVWSHGNALVTSNCDLHSYWQSCVFTTVNGYHSTTFLFTSFVRPYLIVMSAVTSFIFICLGSHMQCCNCISCLYRLLSVELCKELQKSQYSWKVI